ncbi:glycosyltransferase [Rothia nasimurium]|uniref:glycosyltransferase n=1 Tax=Rothia nasimurium TaxID=85336 RepID=UPI001F371AD9|nr:glycosyltransferase [Rothia nasimurium]
MTGLIIHEWIEKFGGSEKVLDKFVETYPDSEIFTLWNNAPLRYPENQVHESLIARTILRGRKALSLPFLPIVWRVLAPKGKYDWALVSSHLFAHQVKVRGIESRSKYVYVHTPARYIWTPEYDARGDNILIKTVAPIFKLIDKLLVDSEASYAANSNFVKERVERFWGITPDVIYPPVEVDYLKSGDWKQNLTQNERKILDKLPEQFIMGASRFIPYKKLDSVIDLAESIDIPVVIAGSGPLEEELKNKAHQANVAAEVIVNPSDALLYSLIERAEVFIFPPIEDFGIMPVEAMALGTKVLVNEIGGAKESLAITSFGACTNFKDLSQAKESLQKLIAEDLSCKNINYFSVASFENNIKKWMGRE